jgi:hypothetical protein
VLRPAAPAGAAVPTREDGGKPASPSGEEVPEQVDRGGQGGCVDGSEADDQSGFGGPGTEVVAQAGGGDAAVGCSGAYLVFDGCAH